MEKHQVHNLIILDESGSMNSIKNTIIEGFNDLINLEKTVKLTTTFQSKLTIDFGAN